MNTDAPQSREELEDAIDVLRTDIREAIKDLTVARKALDALARKGSLDRLDKVVKERKRFAKRDLKPYGYGDTARNVLDGIERYERKMRRSVRHQVLNDLKDAADEEGFRFELIGDSPPTVLIRPLTAELDTENGRVTVMYGRETVIECGLDAGSIIDAREKAMKRIKKAAMPSEEFFDILRAAYRMVCVRTSVRPGERVDIVDLLGPLAVLTVDPNQWRKLNKIDPFPRYMLGYQLLHLRRDGVMQRNGRRIDLGTATGGSARNKTNVIYVPTSPTDGQYYLSIRFTPA